MASRLAQHLPSLFGPSRRAAWRLSIVRRTLAATALLLALHLVSGTAGPAPAAVTATLERSGPQLSLPLALPADHLAPGDVVGVYLPGSGRPVVTGARVLGTSQSPSGQPVARITLRERDVGPILENLGDATGAGGAFVLVVER